MLNSSALSFDSTLTQATVAGAAAPSNTSVANNLTMGSGGPAQQFTNVAPMSLLPISSVLGALVLSGLVLL
jgi:hypothetical protein